VGLLRKLTSTLAGYLVLYGEVTQEIGRIAADFFSLRWRRFRALPASEQAFALLTAIVIIFTFLPWRAYQIRFGDDPARRHGIYSDDFTLILLGCLLAVLPLAWYLMPAEPKKLPRSNLLRLGGAILVLGFALLNWIFPQRIAATKEATFAWSFYVFQLVAVLWAMTGILGGRTYAQYPVRN
jgi:uncharacterized protein YjeT (DUF2065 family)